MRCRARFAYGKTDEVLVGHREWCESQVDGDAMREDETSRGTRGRDARSSQVRRDEVRCKMSAMEHVSMLFPGAFAGAFAGAICW